jgi:sensor domain CHASE-containing protein
MADWMPPIAFLAAFVVILWRFFDVTGSGIVTPISAFLTPFVVLLAVLIVLHVLTSVLLPLRWHAIRGEFQKRLEQRLRSELESVYAPLPGDVADALAAERRRVQQIERETQEVAEWLARREQAASITSLYGN